ncbi:Stk1 family PASTA domain-containing Ser/Thr kinase [Psychrobacillus sp. FJAT-21963]|uniref:Stk1 family PASTA domain-containing Ser/Thr kinase n=1 Tax=Psychrobacillus sp. FJAT-21963 TaxID=1712028 RepID=UPI0006F2A650|nr:Stk1 family PASTA domain-containing Ser/Thr kinase [Psychrobacillus sp. FJAT-21963]KQL35473.1 serine/threonine protein kinase [Psychrobacillus sp. FJAT-21963]
MLIGKRISGRYKLLEMIGGGGMSHVYLAHDMILDRDVAIKVLRYDFSNEEELRRRFQREALSATSLTHPNIVNIYDVGEDEDIHYIVMEYVRGETLKQYIQRNAPVSPVRTVTIMRQLTSAIANAHNNHIIHRDIKPQNILLDEEGKVKITDFGIAMALSATSYTQTNSVLGTVHYLSPEQARGGTATNRSDIYALGIVLFELLTGQLPFSGESAVSIALKHLQTETPSIRSIIPSIPQSLENVVLKATAKDPNNRYQSAEEMEEDLATALSPERADEAKFVIAVDNDATKVLPVIKEPIPFEEVSETKKIPVAPTKLDKTIPKKKIKKWKIVTGVIAGVLLLALLFVILFPGLFKPDKVEVPDVANLDVQAAIEQIEAEGFVVGEEILEFSDEVEEGNVIRTSPEAGKLREKETKIDLFVSSGKESSEIADYRGRNIDEVKELLSNSELRSIEPEEQFSEKPIGEIIGQDPPPGTEIIPSETDLVFTVSKGLDLRSVSDLKDWNEKALKDYERTSGFKIKIAGSKYSDTIQKGNVISQEPQANKKVAPGSTIEVVVSDGPKPASTKLVVKTVTIPYEPPNTEEEEGGVEGEEDEEQPTQEEQVVRIYVQDKTRTMAVPIEEFVLTQTVEKHIKLEISEGQKAAYRIEVGNTIFAQETIDYKDVK